MLYRGMLRKQAGMALPVGLCIMTLCFLISLHVLSMALDQRKAIQRELSGFQTRQQRENDLIRMNQKSLESMVQEK